LLSGGLPEARRELRSTTCKASELIPDLEYSLFVLE